MAKAPLFPRTNVGGVSCSRLVIGTNWFLGFTHCTAAKDDFIRSSIRTDYKKIADILEVFFRAGVDTIVGLIQIDPLATAIEEARQRTGVGGIVMSTPWLPSGPDTPFTGWDLKKCTEILDEEQRLGTCFCMPHQSVTDNMVDRCSRTVRKMDVICKMIRDRKMIPGLSTHMPESIVYADETGLDVETYISIYNSMGFLMQVEVDWIAKVIQNAKKPVLTIKPLASGQLRPFQALTFVWNTIRPMDMVAIGCMTPKEAAEAIEMSLGILGRGKNDVTLQQTRSKASITAKKPTK
jgi:hypothetical protein